jgi:Effector-associated domain 11/CHAT domain
MTKTNPLSAFESGFGMIQKYKFNQMKQSLLDLIAEGKLKEALDTMQKVKDTQNSYFKEYLINCLSRFNCNENDRNAGVISLGDYRMERSKIAVATKSALDSEFDENAVPATFKINHQEAAKPDHASPPPKTDKINILMLTALPAGTTELDLNKEMARINEKLQEKPTDFTVVVKRGVNQDEFKEITEISKPTILHFSGHGIDGGAQGGLVLQNEEKNGYELLSPKKLDALFKYFKRTFQIQTVLLNACWSNEQAQVIAKHVPYVIGTTVEIDNNYCVAFSIGFYFKLAISGHDYEQAFDSGRTAAVMKGANESDFVFYKQGQIHEIC